MLLICSCEQIGSHIKQLSAAMGAACCVVGNGEQAVSALMAPDQVCGFDGGNAVVDVIVVAMGSQQQTHTVLQCLQQRDEHSASDCLVLLPGDTVSHVFPEWDFARVDYLDEPIASACLDNRLKILIDSCATKQANQAYQRQLKALQEELATLQVQLQFNTTHDPMTQLPNRQLMLDRIQQVMAYSLRYHKQFALLHIDIDNLHEINEHYGRQYGDAFIKAIAAILQRQIRHSDSVARVGDDEFILLLAQVNAAENAGKVADLLLKILSRAVIIEGKQQCASASIGITIGPNDGQVVSDLLEHAEAAMHSAKRRGKNNYQFYQAAMQKHTSETVQLTQDFRYALRTEQFFLHFQPQVDITNSRLVGMEVLIRWQHPQLGQVMPNQFIALAEKTGFILPLGLWIFQKACATYRRWRAQYGVRLKLGINLSVKQFSDKQLVEKLVDVAAQAEIDNSDLQLEITESIFVDDLGHIVPMLKQLKAAGFEIVMDDFGTGYSCLSYLKHLPIDVLKIDRSFVRHLQHNSSDRAIVKTIVDLARNLGLLTLAEGIEAPAQIEYLRMLGCDQLQGYWISKPLPEQSAEAYLARRASGGSCTMLE